MDSLEVFIISSSKFVVIGHFSLARSHELILRTGIGITRCSLREIRFIVRRIDTRQIALTLDTLQH